MNDDIPVAPTDRPRRSNIGQSRGRPADPDAVPEIEFLDEDGQPLTRRSRHESGDNPFDVPANLRKSGWDYEWKNDRVYNQPVDPAEHVTVREAGWRPVRADDMRALCPPGWDKPYIERGGMTLYTRPMHLTEEARAEDLAVATKVKQDKLAASAIGHSISRDPRMPAGPTKDGMSIEGRMGHHHQPGKAERAGAR